MIYVPGLYDIRYTLVCKYTAISRQTFNHGSTAETRKRREVKRKRKKQKQRHRAIVNDPASFAGMITVSMTVYPPSIPSPTSPLPKPLHLLPITFLRCCWSLARTLFCQFSRDNNAQFIFALAFCFARVAFGKLAGTPRQARRNPRASPRPCPTLPYTYYLYMHSSL